MFRNEMFANYLKYKTAPFLVPLRSPALSTRRFVVYDTPVWHSATRMYACHVCSKYSAKYDPINYGYTLDGDIHYNIRTKIADLIEYQKRQIALGALYSNTPKHLDLRHKQYHHAIGTVGVGRKPSQHYNALYGFMTMKEDILRDYQKPKDSEQSTRQIYQALLLLKKNHRFYSRFLAHYETLYRYLENAATTMGTLTQRSYEDKCGATWNTIYKMSTLLGLWSVMPHGTSFRISVLTRTKWASSIGHPSEEQVGTLPWPLNRWPMTLICI